MARMAEHDYKNYPELTNAQLEQEELTSPHQQIKEDFVAKVVKVHDGDTIRVLCDFRDFTFPIRLIDIDAPELSEGGHEARDWLKEQIQGEEVEIKINRFKRVGKYGRLLGRVISRGLDMGEAELSLGLAVPFGKKQESEPPPVEKIFRLEQWF